ncbi:hypothetical protein LXL04_018976 [Taraxacum kok-saghyz]
MWFKTNRAIQLQKRAIYLFYGGDDAEYGGREDSEDSHYLVDPDAVVDCWELDMREFHNAVDEVEWFGQPPQNQVDLNDQVDGLEVVNNNEFESAGPEEDLRKRMLKNLNKKVSCSSEEITTCNSLFPCACQVGTLWYIVLVKWAFSLLEPVGSDYRTHCHMEQPRNAILFITKILANDTESHYAFVNHPFGNQESDKREAL